MKNNEPNNGCPLFTTIQLFKQENIKATLKEKIQTKEEDQNRNPSSKAFHFLDHFCLYLGLFHSLFNYNK